MEAKQQYRNLLIYFLKLLRLFITGNSLIGFAKLIFIVGFVAI
jgi:hypothetical protein